jgi:hypothetical protein
MMRRSERKGGEPRRGPATSASRAVAVTLMLLVVACSDPAPGGNPGVLNGTASSWIGEPGTARAMLYPFGPDVARGPIAVDGSFSIELPARLDAELLVPLTLCEGIVISGDARGAAVFWLLVETGSDTWAGAIGRTNRPFGDTHEVGDAATTWWYADAPIAAHGTCDASQFDLERTAFAMDLVRGWNVVTQVVTAVVGDVVTIEFRTSPAPGTFEWRYFATTKPIDVPMPAPDQYEPNDDRSVATEIILDFNAPELTITPGDVDWFTFTLIQPATIVADVSSFTFDALLGLFDANGDIIEGDDYGSVDPRIEASLDAGTYYLAVTGYPDAAFQGDHYEDGSYALTVETTP